MRISNFSTYIKAVIEVEAEGFFVERLINLCKINNIKIWDITYLTSGKIKFLISPKEFKKLKPYVKKSKCKIKIVSKKGIYFNLFRYRKRRIVIYLTILIFLCMLLASSFVWRINICGNSKISTEELQRTLENIGIHRGKNKIFISKGKIVDYLRTNIYDIAWVGIDINGTTMNVTVREKKISKEEDKNLVGNVVATKAALITKIIAENGTAKYKTGSYIEKNSVAIEGIITSEFIDPIFVHASGIVRGQVDYIFEKNYKYNDQVKEYTSKKRHGIGIGINNKEIILKYLPNKFKYDISNSAKMFKIFSVNISFIFNTYEEYILKDIVNTKEDLISKGEQESDLYLKRIMTEEAKLLNKKVDLVTEKDGITYKVTFSLEENIGEFVEAGDK